MSKATRTVLSHPLGLKRFSRVWRRSSLTDASLRWLRHHSALSPQHGDGLIIGASTLAHAHANLAALAGGPLPADVVAAFDEAWAIARPCAFPYFRDYGARAGSADAFLALHHAPEHVPRSVTY